MARQHQLTVKPLPHRGKGSHQLYAILDRNGDKLCQFMITGHRRELSWTVVRRIESVLAPIFGDAWMEEK
jgi:hypothetical protein